MGWCVGWMLERADGPSLSPHKHAELVLDMYWPPRYSGILDIGFDSLSCLREVRLPFTTDKERMTWTSSRFSPRTNVSLSTPPKRNGHSSPGINPSHSNTGALLSGGLRVIIPRDTSIPTTGKR